MIRRGTVSGNASPILKTFVAFNMKELPASATVLAFEHRFPSAVCDTFAFEYGQLVSASALNLPKGKFALHSAFYESPTIDQIVDKKDETVAYESIGALAESINLGSEVALEAEHYLNLACKCLVEAFSKSFKDMPSEAALSAMCVTGENYAETQLKLYEILGSAQEQGEFNELMFNAMSKFHEAYTQEFCVKENAPVVDDLIEYHFYEAMPLGIAPESTVAKVYGTFLPILLASGIGLDQASFFNYRLSRGRKILRKFTKGMPIDDRPIEVLIEAFQDKIETLVPYMPDYSVQQIKENGTLRLLARAIVQDTWYAVPHAYVDSEEIDDLLSALCLAISAMQDDLDD